MSAIAALAISGSWAFIESSNSCVLSDRVPYAASYAVAAVLYSVLDVSYTSLADTSLGVYSSFTRAMKSASYLAAALSATS